MKLTPSFRQDSKKIGQIWNPKETGDSLEGILVKAIPNKGIRKNVYLYLFEVEGRDDYVGVMGTYLLDKQWQLYNYVGHQIKLVYLGKAKTRGGTMKLFEADVSDEPVLKNEGVKNTEEYLI